uniref:Uncharacterized protein n=1 Tax=Anguilla anguilla TaxID=7936 RepID=A0A0E9X3W8_ANGAN
MYRQIWEKTIINIQLRLKEALYQEADKIYLSLADKCLLHVLLFS